MSQGSIEWDLDEFDTAPLPDVIDLTDDDNDDDDDETDDDETDDSAIVSDSEPVADDVQVFGWQALFNEPWAVHGVGLTIAPSTIEGAGFGVFAKSRFIKGEIITLYYGEKIERIAALERRSEGTHIVPLIARGWYVDGLRFPNGIRIVKPEIELIGRPCGAYINSTRGTQRQANARFDFVDYPINEDLLRRFMDGENVTADPNQREVIVVATRSIEVNEEVLIDYNIAYAQSLL